MLRLHKALTAALPLAGTRQLSDGPTVEELQLEAEFTAAMEAALESFYRYPFRDGIEAVPVGTEAEVRRWILSQYADDAATAVLLFVLIQYLRRGVNVGGGLALAELGLPGTFNLTNPAIVNQVERYAARLITQASSRSLVKTTANELARQITLGRAAGLTDAELIDNLGTWMANRVATRSTAIAATESIVSSRGGLALTYSKNGIDWMIHRTVETACPVCAPLEGERYPAVRGFVVGAIPLHPNCRCWAEPETDEWVIPEDIWTGG
jgi:hypothetical protein